MKLRPSVIATVLLGVWVPATQANCNATVELTSKDSAYEIHNPGFPDSYSGENNCYYNISADSGYNILLDCILEMPKGKNASVCLDYIEVIGSFGSATQCDSFLTESFNQSLVIMFHSQSNTTGGRYNCTVSTTRMPCDCGMKGEGPDGSDQQETGVHEYVSSAGLMENDEFYCGATIVSLTFVLTTASCVQNRTFGNTMVVVGAHNKSEDPDKTTADYYHAAEFIVHPDWNKTTQARDLALVRVTRAIGFGKDVAPACMPFNGSSAPLQPDTLTLVGWTADSSELKQTEVDVVSPEVCDSPFDENSQICTNSTVCGFLGGDSLLSTNTTIDRYFLMGTTSDQSSRCGDTPSRNTKIDGTTISWIEDVTKEDFCFK